VTTPLGLELADPLPLAFVAVTTTSTVEPTSLAAPVYVAAVAPEMFVQFAPDESQSCH
jgi:hypothetical protein